MMWPTVLTILLAFGFVFWLIWLADKDHDFWDDEE